MTYDPSFQTSEDGPLSDEFRSRIQNIRSETKLTLADIAKAMGISGGFLSNLLRSANAAPVRTKNIRRMSKGLENLEAEHLGSAQKFGSEALIESSDLPAALDEASLEELVRSIHGKGFSVTLEPLRIGQ